MTKPDRGTGDYIDDGLRIPCNTEKGFMEAHEGDGVIHSWKGARGVVQDGSMPTLLTSCEKYGVVVKDE